MRTMLTILVVAIGASSAIDAQARKVFRCNGSLVDTGLTIPEVLARCGEPDARDVSSVPVRARNIRGATYVVGTATLEHWVYRRRGGQFPAYLTFDEGRLRDIEFIGRR